MATRLTQHDMLLGRDAKRQKVELGRNPPSWVGDEGVWEEAKKRARESRSQSDPLFWGLVTHIYKNAGGRVK